MSGVDAAPSFLRPRRRLVWAIRRAVDGVAGSVTDAQLALLVPTIDVEPYRAWLAEHVLRVWQERHVCDAGCACRPPGAPSAVEAIKHARRGLRDGRR